MKHNDVNKLIVLTLNIYKYSKIGNLNQNEFYIY